MRPLLCSSLTPEYRFYKAIGELDAFKQRWCYNIICFVD